MSLATLSAIRAIVAVHATYNRDHLLAHLDAAIEDARKHETPSQTEVATVALGGSPERPESTTNGVDWTQSHKDRRAPHLARTRPGPWPTGLEST